MQPITPSARAPTGALVATPAALLHRLGVRCFACDAPVDLASGQRVGFRDTCDRCDADLHVCRNCSHHDPGAYNECREPGSERVGDRERANRCEWFTPSAGSAGGPAGARDAARSALDDLFKKG